jgi:polysaccharide biosynthesis protein PslA
MNSPSETNIVRLKRLYGKNFGVRTSLRRLQLTNSPSYNKNGYRYDFHLITKIIFGLVACLDMLVMFGASYLVFISGYSFVKTESFPIFIFSIVISVLLTVVAFYFYKLYAIESILKQRTAFLKIFCICALTCMTVLPTAFALNVSNPSSSLMGVFYWYIYSASSICLMRMLVGVRLISWAQDGTLVRNIVIVGAGEQSALMVETLKKNSHPWINIVGIFDDRSERGLESIDENFRMGNVDTLISMAREWQLDEILIALPWGAEDRISVILNKLQVLPVNIRLCPESLCFKVPNYGYSNYSGIRILKMLDKPLSGWNYIIKTVEDKILATFILALISPILIVIAVLIKLDSPGPVFFRQKRYGFNNQLINMFKFRSMYVDKQDNNASQLTTKDDPRVTKLGSFLRRASLDELPQFLNVLTGEMSIVGPRPHAKEAKAAGQLYEDVVFQYAARHKVKPGITGWAQVNGWRGETDTEEKIHKRVEYDIDYINRWSLLFDLKIIAKTIFVVIVGQNAY